MARLHQQHWAVRHLVWIGTPSNAGGLARLTRAIQLSRGRQRFGSSPVPFAGGRANSRCASHNRSRISSCIYMPNQHKIVRKLLERRHYFMSKPGQSWPGTLPANPVVGRRGIENRGSLARQHGPKRRFTWATVWAGGLRRRRTEAVRLARTQVSDSIRKGRATGVSQK